jgi:hypothetical protein
MLVYNKMNNNQQEIDLYELAQIVFYDTIKPKNYYVVQFDQADNLQDLYKSLLMFFTEGMKILYGKDGKVDLLSVSEENFKNFNLYMNSIHVNCTYKIYQEYEYDQMYRENFMIKEKNKLSDYRFKLKVTDKIFVLYFEII